ncbi:hypothetical protein ABR737_03730 [Streptomyces sp. Edi2]|uniref:hypothetical protein n=1 Tax=Streptomyces sp. Edi2 TaxID=3162528 RepID=UPI003305CE95
MGFDSLAAVVPAHREAARAALDQAAISPRTCGRCAMYSPTTPADEHRALAAQQEASAALGVTVEGRRLWGYQARTLGQKAHLPDQGACWLRLISAPAELATGKPWEGTTEAAAAFPGVRKPALHGIHDGTERDGTAYRRTHRMHRLPHLRRSPC